MRAKFLPDDHSPYALTHGSRASSTRHFVARLYSADVSERTASPISFITLRKNPAMWPKLSLAWPAKFIAYQRLLYWRNSSLSPRRHAQQIAGVARLRKRRRSNFGPIQEGDCATFSAVSDTRCSTYLIFTAFLTAECSTVELPGNRATYLFSF